MKVVVMSCDKNQDLWYPFYHCMEKYWPNHPEIIYSTETFNNPYYKTIKLNYSLNEWSKRVHDTVAQLDDKYILLMVDDIFLREPVNNDLINSLTNYLTPCVAAINFEWSFDKDDRELNDILMIRNEHGKYKASVMCQLWNKTALLEIFNKAIDCWSFEKKANTGKYSFLISKKGDFLNWGKRHDTWHWAVVRGKWTEECKDFLDSEGIKIDYSIRGFIDKEEK